MKGASFVSLLWSRASGPWGIKPWVTSEMRKEKCCQISCWFITINATSGSQYFTGAGRSRGDQRIKFEHWRVALCYQRWQNLAVFHKEWILLYRNHSWFFFQLLFLFITWYKKKRFTYQVQNILPPAMCFAS